MSVDTNPRGMYSVEIDDKIVEFQLTYELIETIERRLDQGAWHIMNRAMNQQLKNYEAALIVHAFVEQKMPKATRQEIGRRMQERGVVKYISLITRVMGASLAGDDPNVDAPLDQEGSLSKSATAESPGGA